MKLGQVALLWKRVGPRFLPFADAATAEVPLSRLLRLSLFQVSVGMAAALMVGTLNRVMIVELGMAAWLVALMVALPILAAPFRALIGHRSDTHASALGWRRVPYIWLGTLLQFGGLAIMPFALLVLTGKGELGLAWLGHAGAAAAFLMTGATKPFVDKGSYSLKSALGLALGGFPAVLIAAYIVKSLPLETLRWGVAAVVLYTGVSMLHTAMTDPKES